MDLKSTKIHAMEMASPTKSAAMGASTAKAAALGVGGKIALGVTAAGVLSAFVAVVTLYGFPTQTSSVCEAVVHLGVHEILHDYAPSGWDQCSGHTIADNPAATVFALSDPMGGFIGSRYWRRQFVQYEADGTFGTVMSSEPTNPGYRTDEWKHLGALGPIIRVNAGDMLRLRLRNKSRFPASFHIHGLHYYSVALVEDHGPNGANGGQAGQGSGDGSGIVATLLKLVGVTTGQSTTTLVDPFSSGQRSILCSGQTACAQLGSVQGTAAQPGQTLEYSILIPDEAGPAAGEPSSVARLYQSLSFEGHDVSLSGFVVVTPRNTKKDPSKASAPTRPADVQHEAAVLFSVNNENDNPYLGLNVLEFVMRGRAAGAGPLQDVGDLAQMEGSAVFPLPGTTEPKDILAALYNEAAKAIMHNHTHVLPGIPDHGPHGGGNPPAPPPGLTVESVDATNADVMYAIGSGFGQSGMITVNTLLGQQLGLVFYAGSTNSAQMIIVDARAYVGRYGQVAAETAMADLALAGLQAEPGFDPGAFDESNLMHSVNSLMYCNVPLVSFGHNTQARWYTAVAGTEVDLHAVHWHGNTVLLDGARADSIPLLPRQVVTVDMTAHSPGKWLLHCHVTDHIHAGMILTYTVLGSTPVQVTMRNRAGTPETITVPSALAPSLTGRIREYYIAAEMANWHYWDGPVTHLDGLHADGSIPECGGADMIMLATALNGTSVWPKAVYVQYTDATFTTRQPIPSEWEHLALMPLPVRAEVGDIIRITFKNRTPRPFSLHPHGVAYPKGSEGAPYVDGTTSLEETGDNAVPTGGSWTYTWWVPDSTGPGPSDSTSMPWLIHGHVHEVQDENAGMIGMIVITGRGKARVPGTADQFNSDLRPVGVDREFGILTKVFEEGVMGAAIPESNSHSQMMPGMSHMRTARMARMAAGELASSTAAHGPAMEFHYHGKDSAAHGHAERMLQDADAQTAQLYGLNGKVACSLPGLTAQTGENVRWYFVSLGNEIDVHHLGVSGHTMVQLGHRRAGVSMMPGTMFTADMTAGPAGDWLLESSVRHHAINGMVATFSIVNDIAHPNAQAQPSASPAPVAASNEIRSYYFAAEEVTWDYAPAGQDKCLPAEARAAIEPDAFPVLPDNTKLDADGIDMNGFPEAGRVFIARGWEAGAPAVGGTTLGKRYKKAVYVSYSDASFNQATYTPGQTIASALRAADKTGPGSASRGILGPTIRAAVGDRLVVTLRNRLAFPANFAFPHGPMLTGLRAGAWGTDISTWTTPAGVDTSALMSQWAVPAGWGAEYQFLVPASAGPANSDAATLAWPYMSTVHPQHLYAGLVGAGIIAASPSGLAPGYPTHGADREYVLLWFISNENNSLFLTQNVNTYAVHPQAVDVNDADFQESNLMHSVNGRLFCNLEDISATLGQTVRLHMLGLGAELDLHTPQVHGTLVTMSKGRDANGKTQAMSHSAVVPLHPGALAAVDFVASEAGSWMAECGVNDHWTAGMRAILHVEA